MAWGAEQAEPVPALLPLPTATYPGTGDTLGWRSPVQAPSESPTNTTAPQGCVPAHWGYSWRWRFPAHMGYAVSSWLCPVLQLVPVPPVLLLCPWEKGLAPASPRPFLHHTASLPLTSSSHPDFPLGTGAKCGEEGRKMLTCVVGFQFGHSPERSTKY